MLIDQSNSLEEILLIVQNEFKKAVELRKHPFRYLVLSTVDRTSPTSRWVVFRNYTEEESILIYTDYRSPKVKELQDTPASSLLLYHNRHQLQIRLNGTMIINHNNELTKAYWPGVKGSGVKDYNTIKAPGEAIDKIGESFEWDNKLEGENFAILEFIPEKMDVLQLNREGHLRASFTKHGKQWKGSFLVP